MKGSLFLGILFFIISHVFAQEVQFPPAVLSAGGGTISTTTEHISKWRIGEVNVLYINSEDLKSNNLNELTKSGLIKDEQITAYPNPVYDILNLQFDVKNHKVICVEVTDISGKKVFLKHKQHILPDQVVQFDFSGLSPGFYLINAYSEDKILKEVFKITKH